MSRNTEKPEKEKCTLQDQDCGEKTEERGKGVTNTVCPGIWRETLKNVKNEYCTLQNLEYGKKTDQKGKSVIHMVDLEYGEKH